MSRQEFRLLDDALGEGMPLGGRAFTIAVATRKPFTVVVEFQGFENEAEALAYAHQLHKHEVFGPPPEAN